MPVELREVLARDLIAAADQESANSVSGGNFTNLKFDLVSGGTGPPTPGDYNVISFRPNFSGVFDAFLAWS